MKIQGSVALVTGANRGLGRAFVEGLLARSAGKIYAGARDPGQVKTPGVEAIQLDVTNAEQVAAAGRRLGDVNLLINNAGIFQTGALLDDDAEGSARRQFETNFFGALAVSRALAPALKKNGGGALVNVLSALSWAVLPGTGSYSATKAAALALTHGLRNELKPQGTLVVAVHSGYIDTDMARGVPGPKVSPEDVVRQVLEALEEDREEVLADAVSRAVKSRLSGAVTA
jgi:NAD(P)-dependent dehydrogenase (short-subunit alcohol dehydrogenase family)